MECIKSDESGLNESEVYRCVMLSTAHMTSSDMSTLLVLSSHMTCREGSSEWIHRTAGGIIIRLNARTDAISWLKDNGLSQQICDILTILSERLRISLIHFDSDADVISGFTEHSW